jgi:lipopolysaccharide assembly protein A
MAYGGDGSQVPLQDDGKSTDARRATRLAVLGIVVVIAAVFIAQNNDRVQLDFLMVGVRTRVWVGMLATLLLGAVLGQAAEVLWRRRRRSDD